MSEPVVVWVPAWHPPSLNHAVGRHWSKLARMKRGAADIVGVYFRAAGGKPITQTYRPVRKISLILSGDLAKRLDQDNIDKVFRDALVRAAVIVDDSPEWAEFAPTVIAPDLAYGTTFTVDDTAVGPPGADPHTRRLLASLARRTKRDT